MAITIRSAVQTRTGRRARSRRSWSVRIAGLVFLLPALVVFGYFAWWPIVSSLGLSFERTNLVTSAFVGLENFQHAFSDPLLPIAVRNTLWYFVLSMLIGFPAPLFVGIVGSELRRAGGVFRVLVYLPVVVPPVVSVLLWKWFYNPDSGLFNTLLGTVGIGPFPWLQDSSWAMPSLVLEATWAGAGGSILIYLAALAGVPTELYEAAEIDGASIWRRAWHVMLPQIRGVILLLLLLQMIGALQIFTEPYVLTDGGPSDSTVTVLLLIYRYAFLRGDYGGAAALTVLLVAALGILSAVYLRLTRRWSA